MKVLILNGSPRRSGNISRLLDAAAEELTARGAEIERLHSFDLHAAPCTGCMACRSSLKCVLPPDDSLRLLSAIKRCDALLIGAPCYWGNMPGQIKMLFDRIVYGMMGESPRGIPRPLHKGKRAAIIATSTTAWPWNILFGQTSGVVKSLREILKWSGFRIAGTLQRGGTKTSSLTQKDLDHARRLAGRLL